MAKRLKKAPPSKKRKWPAKKNSEIDSRKKTKKIQVNFFRKSSQFF
jgi:hypothetical protein